MTPNRLLIVSGINIGKKKEWRNIRKVGALKEKTILDQPPVSVCLCGHFR